MVSGECFGTPDRGLWLAHHAVIFCSLPCVVYIIPSTVFSCIMGQSVPESVSVAVHPHRQDRKSHSSLLALSHNKKEASIDDKKSGEKKKT